MNKNKGSHYRFNGFRHRKGFSIIEIISAIVVLSILATISVNLMSDYKVRQNISGARQQIMNAMTGALAAATRDNLPYAIRFNGSHQVKVCDFQENHTATVRNCDDEDYISPFEHDLAMFSKPIITVGNTQRTLGTSSSDSTYINYTSFGRIQVSSNIKATIDNNGFYTIFIDDQEGNLAKQELCIGIKFNANGYVESVEQARNGTSGC